MRKCRRVDPYLLRTLERHVGPTFVDIGAGAGAYVEALIATGRTGYGIDGAQDVEEASGGLVLQRDLTKPVIGARRMHTGICIEVGEHIAAEHEVALWENIRALVTTQLIMSWATPYQDGQGHVNCRSVNYVAARMAAFGFPVDRGRTALVRQGLQRRWQRKLLVGWRS